MEPFVVMGSVNVALTSREIPSRTVIEATVPLQKRKAE